MIQVHYIYCALYFHYYYISSTSVHQAVDPGSKWYMPLKLTTWIQRTVIKEGELCVQCPPPLWRLLVYAALITELQQLPYFTTQHIQMKRSFPGGSVEQNLPAMQETWVLIPGPGRSSGVGNGNPLQYPCLENSMDRWARWATVHGASKALDTTKWLNNTDEENNI